MELVRYQSMEKETAWGVLDGSDIHQVELPVDELFGRLGDSPSTLLNYTHSKTPAEAVSLVAPLLEQSRIFGIAQNYPKHANEVGSTAPDVPVFFIKPPSAFARPGVPVAIPTLTKFLDYEGELGVVIGAPGRSVPPKDAYDYIAGYTVCNDGSARDLTTVQLGPREIIDWFSVKALDQCSAIGPLIVPKERVKDPMGLRLTTTLNGEKMQEDSTASMVFDIATQLAFISERVSLRPGDVLMTGTPSGVGKARGRPLQDGDQLTVAVESVGVLEVSFARSTG